MRRPSTRAALTAGATAALGLTVAFGPLVQAAPPGSATGHGFYDAGNGQKRQFSFNAIDTAGDGTATGNAEVHNPAFAFDAHIKVSCLLVDGNRASVGGTVTKSNDPGLPPGTFAFWTVYDNGEPGAGHDTISAVFFDFEAAPPTCQLIGPNDFDQTTIQGGNIQVRQGG